MHCKDLGENIKVTDLNVKHLSEVLKIFHQNYKKYKYSVTQYPLQVTFCNEYHSLLYDEKELDILINNLSTKLEEYYKNETEKWFGNGI